MGSKPAVLNKRRNPLVSQSQPRGRRPSALVTALRVGAVLSPLLQPVASEGWRVLPVLRQCEELLALLALQVRLHVPHDAILSS